MMYFLTIEKSSESTVHDLKVTMEVLICTHSLILFPIVRHRTKLGADLLIHVLLFNNIIIYGMLLLFL